MSNFPDNFSAAAFDRHHGIGRREQPEPPGAQKIREAVAELDKMLNELNGHMHCTAAETCIADAQGYLTAILSEVEGALRVDEEQVRKWSWERGQ